MDVNTLIARRLKDLRSSHGLSLDALAERSGVSRSNISLIERGESSPTATILAKLAAALGASLPSMFEESPPPAAEPSPVSRAAEQLVWTDPASGYIRRQLSPAVRSPIQLVEVVFPAGARVSYDSNTPREADIHQQIWQLEGVMELAFGGKRWRLEPGDCLAMRQEGPTVFRNPGRKQARYVIAVVTLPLTMAKRS